MRTVVLLTVLVCTHVLSDRLPATEAEAVALVRAGDLSADIWERLQPYYAQPAAVPRGELPALVAAVPELSHGRHVPAAADLSRYEPWRPRDIQRCMADYPLLDDLRPVLSFVDTERDRRLGSVAVTAVGSRTGDVLDCRIHTRLRVPRMLRSELHVVQQGGRWRTRERLLTFTPGRPFSLYVGSFSPRIPDRLCTGRYQPPEDSSGSWAESMLLPDSRRHNGVLGRADPVPWLAAEAWYHHGAGEEVCAAHAEIAAGRFWGVRTGVSRVEVSGGPSHTIVRVGGQARTRAVRFTADCSVPVTGSRPPAWECHAVLGQDGNALHLNAIRVPARYPASRSAHASSVADTADAQGGTRVSARLQLGTDAVRLSPWMTCHLGEMCRAGLQARIRRWGTYRMAYRVRMLLDDPGVHTHVLHASVRAMVCRWLELGGSARLRAQREQLALTAACSPSVVSAAGRTQISMAFARADDGTCALEGGIRHTVAPGGGARGSVSLSCPLAPQTRQHGGRINASIHIGL